MQTRHLMPLVVVLLLALVVFPGAVQATSPTPPAPGSAAALAKETNGHAHIATHSKTGEVNFVGTEPGHPISQPAPLPSKATPEQAARGFMATYGPAFGIKDQARELKTAGSEKGELGRAFTRFQQVAGGVPVFGGEMVVQTDANSDVLSANGDILPEPAVGITPTVAAARARATALQTVAQLYKVDPGRLSAGQPELWVYNPILVGGPGAQISSLVWRVEVALDDPPARELVLVHAQLGGVLLHFNQIDSALYRRVYDNSNDNTITLPGASPVRIEGQAATGNANVDKAYDNAGIFYNYYLNTHARDSIDGNGMGLTATVRYCAAGSACPYANAFWNGSQMVYGDGYANGLDVVAHEMTHGVTDNTSHLMYFNQSGAINESLSDVWGEIIEQTNGSSDAGWLIGEGIPGGAIRSMSNPPTYNDPDRMTSNLYQCDATLADNGGVHTNSGVNNKAAYLMAQAIGLTKTAKIYYEVQTHYLTSASNFRDLYNTLQQACTGMVGFNGITQADCQQVKVALDAVQMDQEPAQCATAQAPICSGNQVPRDVFFDNLENPASGNWTTNTGFYYPQNPNNYAFDPTYATSGKTNIWGVDLDSSSTYSAAMTKDITIPAAGAYLRFNHAYIFRENNSTPSDGGIVEYSTNGGTSWTDLRPLLTVNGYNATLVDSPLSGQLAFARQSYGYISSRADLGSLANQKVRFRFRIGSSSASNQVWYGWFIDDIRVYSCVAKPTGNTVYLPIVLRNWPLLPGAPTLNPIGATGPDGTFVVKWALNSMATLYTLQEDTSASFTNPKVVYQGTWTSWASDAKTPGTYYYRVKAASNWGESGWSNSQSVTVVAPPASQWQTVFSNNFNTSLSPWTVYDNNGSGYSWSRSSCEAFSGTYSAWAVGGGNSGSGLTCGSDYPDDVDSWIDYGPFSTLNKSKGELNFQLWINSEADFDTLCRLASVDGSNYYGWCTSGTNASWGSRTLDFSDIPEVGNVLNQSQVWVSIAFTSDSGQVYREGALVDDTTLRLCPTGGNCPATAANANGPALDVAGSHDFPVHLVKPSIKR